MSKLQVDEIVNKEDTGSVTLPKGAVVTGVTTSTSFSGSASGLTAIPAGNLTGTIPDARFPATLPAVSGANLTGIDAAPSFTGIASGSLSNGQTVIITSDGKVMGVAGSGSGQALGNTTIFESSFCSAKSAAYDTNSNKVVIAYRDEGDSSKGKAVVGTVNGNSISFGTEVIFHTGTTINICATFDSSNNKVVITYANGNSGNEGVAIVGTVNGTSISFGTPVVFDSGNQAYAGAEDRNVVFDSNANKIVICYADGSNSGKGTAIVGTVSGTSISFGSNVIFRDASTSYVTAVFDSTNNKVVIVYQGTSSRGTAIVGTVSGTSISFGTAVQFDTNSTRYYAPVYDTFNQKVVIPYQDEGVGGSVGNYGTAIVGTVSGTSISFGTKVYWREAESNFISASYDSAGRNVIIAFEDDGEGGDPGALFVGSVSGTSISFGSKVQFETGETRFTTAVYDPDENRTIIAFKDGGDSDKGKAVVFKANTEVTNLTTDNFIGFSNAAYTNGQSAKIQVVGSINDAQSGLSTGKKYYVQLDGTLGIGASSISVEAGTALSATQILIR